ncbi:hypothetical protein [Nocardia salmonicida]
MSKRADHPDLDPAQHHHLHSGGLDEPWVDSASTRNSGLAVAS